MKKIGIVIVLALALTGCASEETYETVSDEIAVPAVATPKQIYVALPEESVMPAMECDNGTLYFCQDYDVCVQTLDAGDMEKTIQTISGFDSDRLTILKTMSSAGDRYDFSWSTAADLGEQICRAAVIDDGSFHYILTVTANANRAKEYNEVWNGLFDSFVLY